MIAAIRGSSTASGGGPVDIAIRDRAVSDNLFGRGGEPTRLSAEGPIVRYGLHVGLQI